ncbi:MAG: hypothetical protein WCO44_01875 [Bacteroidota bacterium]
MARTEENVIVRKCSGKVGNVVLTSDGIIRSRPDMSRRNLSEKQQKQVRRFSKAVAYAREVVNDAQMTGYYSGFLKRMKTRPYKKHMGISQAAIMDFLHPPEIAEVKLHRMVDHSLELVIDAKDILPDIAVTVSFLAPGGQVIWACMAEKQLPGNRYHCPLGGAVQLLPGSQFRVCAMDLPGNKTEKEYDIQKLKVI